MSQEIAIIVIAIVAGFAGVVYFIHHKLSAKKEDSEALKYVTEWMKQMQSSFENRLDQNTKTLHQQLAENREAMDKRLTEAARVIGNMQKEMGGLSSVMGPMRDLLSAPKTRGNFGEMILEELLRQNLPHTSFRMQYKFKSGETVDAIIILDGLMLCIDSKFPMENFKAIFGAATDDDRAAFEKNFVRDVKKHIDDISKKYILPQEQTYDFALMYIPSEAVYYEILRNDTLMEHARGKRVSLVSPQAMYYYLYIVAQALKGQKINEMAKEVLKYFSAIKQESGKFGRELEVLSRHITNAKNSLDGVNNSYGKLNEKVERAAELQAVETKIVAEALPVGAKEEALKN